MFATAPLLAAWLPERWLRNVWRAASGLAAAAILLAGGGWAIDNIALRPSHSQPIFSLVNFDLAGIVAHGGVNAYPNLRPATARRMTALCYDPAQYNPTYRADCDGVEIALSDYAATHHRQAISILFGAIAASPLAYLHHRLDHLNRNWRFLVTAVPDDAVYVMTTDNPFGLRFEPNPATKFVAHAARIMAVSPLGRPATWIAVALGLLLVGTRLRSRYFVTGLALSSIGYGASYAFFSVAPDLRYNLWTMLAAMMALVVACAELWGRPDNGRRRLFLAALPCMVAISGELVTLALG